MEYHQYYWVQSQPHCLLLWNDVLIQVGAFSTYTLHCMIRWHRFVGLHVECCCNKYLSHFTVLTILSIASIHIPFSTGCIIVYNCEVCTCVLRERCVYMYRAREREREIKAGVHGLGLRVKGSGHKASKIDHGTSIKHPLHT